MKVISRLLRFVVRAFGLILFAPVLWYRWLSHKWRCRVSVMVFPLLSLGLFLGTVRQIDAGGCPLAFDLNNNDAIDITGHVSTQDKLYTLFSLFDFGTPSFVEFDIFADGDPQRIDWIKPDTDAFLVDFRAGVPREIDGRHLFGTAGFFEGGDQGFDNGFDKLRVLDADRSGFIEGAELQGLALWKDNGDARFDSSEIVELQHLKVQSIPVTPFPPRSGPGETTPYGLERMYAYAATAQEPGQLTRRSIYVEDIWFLTADQPHDADLFLRDPVGFTKQSELYQRMVSSGFFKLFGA